MITTMSTEWKHGRSKSLLWPAHVFQMESSNIMLIVNKVQPRFQRRKNSFSVMPKIWDVFLIVPTESGFCSEKTADMIC